MIRNKGKYNFSNRKKKFFCVFFSYFVFLSAYHLIILSPLLHAVVLDDYTSTATVAITTQADTGATAAIASAGGADGNSVQLTYTLGSGNWSQFYRDYTSHNFAIEGGNTVRFRAKASGNQNMLEIKFVDSDSTEPAKCDKLVFKTLTNPDDQWRTYTLHFSSFTLYPDGNSSFELAKVSKIAVGTTKEGSSAGSGVLYIDKIELYKSTSLVIDNFEDGADGNLLGGESASFTGSGGTATRQYATVGSDKVMELTYDATASGGYSGLTLGLRNRNFQGYTHISFRVRGNVGGELLKAGLESPGGTTKVAIHNHLSGGITTSFQTVTIPISTFTNVTISSITVFSITAENSLGSGSGKIWIDDVQFIRSGETSGAVRVLDEMDVDPNSTNWESFAHSDGSMQVTSVLDSTVPGAKSDNRVYKLAYTFKDSSVTPYTVIERPLLLSMAAYSGLKFRYNGTGSANNIEFKLTDSDNTTWFKKFALASNTGGDWKTVSVPFDQLVYFSAGDDSNLNLKKIKQVAYAMAKGSGGSGTFAVDSLEAQEGAEFETTSASRLISTFKTINNPFSPNGDGTKDEVFFVYTLGSASKINFKIYSLDGVEVKTVAVQDQTVGEQTLSWNGLDSNNEKVPNGLYLYRLEAEGFDGRKDLMRHVVAVLK